MDNLFLAASRRQLRFATTRGHITTEDLWQLNLKSLDQIGQNIMSEMKPGTASLLENPDPKLNAEQQDNELRLEIIKAVIQIKQEENKASVALAAKRQQKAFVSELIAKKRLGALEEMTIEQLEEQLKGID